MTTLPQTSQVRLPRPTGMLPAPTNGHGLNGVAPNGAGHGASLGGQGGAQAMTLADVWRVLRGNLWLIFAFLFASAIAGYCINDYLVRYHSRYTAHGYVSIQAPTVYDPQTRSTITLGDFPGLAIEQRTQAMLIKNESLFTRVLQNPSSAIRNTSWYHRFEVPVTDPTGTINTVFDSVAAKQSLADSFAAAPVDQTNLIDVSMTYSNNRDARDIVEAIVDQHLKMQETLLQDRQLDKSTVLDSAKIRETAHIKELEDNVHQRALELNIDSSGDTDTARFSTQETELSNLVTKRLQIATNLADIKSRQDQVKTALSNGQEPDGVEEAVRKDPDVKRYTESIDDLQIRIKSLYEAEPNNRTIKDLQATLDATQDKLQEASAIARVNARNALVDGLKADANNFQEQLDITDKEIQTIRDKMNEMSMAMTEYLSLRDELTRSREELAQTTAAIDALNTQIQQTANGVQWETKPITPDTPSFPKLAVTMAVAIMGGLSLSVGIAFLREMTDTTVRSPRDISRVGSLTLLGMIPHEDDDPQSAGVPLPTVIYQAPTSIMAEGFRQVRTRLQHSASLDTTRSIMVTSSSPGDGKSLVASNLAAGLALNGRRILLVDSNFRKPSLDKSFGINNNLGFSDVLTSLDRFDSAVHKTQVPNLDLMPTGPRPSNPTELIESQILLDFIERSLEEYDHIIFDTGPMLLVSETAALAPRVDGVITVVRARSNSRGLLQRMRDNLRALKAEHLGVVLNAVRSQGGGYYGRNIKTYYEYQTAQAN
jgi:succinoglycan biosynthesis transport protein ExoP